MMETRTLVLQLSAEMNDQLERLIRRKRRNRTTIEDFIKSILSGYLRLNDADCDEISLETINMKLNMLNDNHYDLMPHIENLTQVCNGISYDVICLKEESGICYDEDDEE